MVSITHVSVLRYGAVAFALVAVLSALAAWFAPSAIERALHRAVSGQTRFDIAAHV